MKITMYPTGVSQPNRNQSSGLQGKCFTPVTRGGSTYNAANCSNQRDPKYHHEWSNAEEILYGRTIQCGRPSTHHCSHATYYGIAGYRNTCPIAGVNGTYTQPATLRLFFDIRKKGINSTARIKNIRLTFEHRCTGVDVANGRESVVWGPNFYGARKYPDHKVFRVRFAGEERYSVINPPLSWNFSTAGGFVFSNATYNNLVNGYIDLIYGNNLETNPGNIYIRNLRLEIEFEDPLPYIESRYQSSDSLFVAQDSACRTTLYFKILAGYKQGSTPIKPELAPKIIQNLVYVMSKPKDTQITLELDSENKDVVRAHVRDNSLEPGRKEVTFGLRKLNRKVTLYYNAVLRNRPEITIPSQIERNTKANGITSIIARGCTSQIIAYDESINNEPKYTFDDLDISANPNEKQDETKNIVKPPHIDAFYEVLSGLSCGWHTLFFKRGNEDASTIPSRRIKILPNNHKFKFIDPETNTEIYEYKTLQNKSSNKEVIIRYLGNPNLIDDPSFEIINSTHGVLDEDDKPTKDIFGEKIWESVDKNGADISIPIGTYYPGTYTIQIQDADIKCANNPATLIIDIEGNHKQYYDEIFVRGEDSTSFDYSYLTALEGDTITEPIYVQTIDLKDSYQDIKICADNNPQDNIAGLTEIKTFDLYVQNLKEEESIHNLFLELNSLIENEDGDIQVTSQEWLNSDGIFYNFKENFEEYNSDYQSNVSIKNLTEDDDFVDEEDVYIHIKELKPQERIRLKIPYGCSTEKLVYLQILLFGQPLALYNTDDCSADEYKFDKIPLRVYDSILTDMSIEGQTDYFETENKPEECPKECFQTKKFTYTIRNVDTSSLDEVPKTVIENDPRLIPTKIIYKGKAKEITTFNESGESLFNGFIEIERGESTFNTKISGERIDVYLKFDNHEEIHLHKYTDYKGEVIFYITIPRTVGGKYTTEDLLQYMSIEFNGNITYNGTEIRSETYTGDIRNKPVYPTKSFSTINVVKENISYYAGQTIPLKISLDGRVKYFKNNIAFYPSIRRAGDEDKIEVYYQICNLDNNEGILKTKFKTDINDYKLIPNEVSKNIYCGVKTDIELNTKLIKTIVENRSINRFYLALHNKKRDNKNVRINIRETNPIEKYDILDYNIDAGIFTVEDGQIIWTINYLEEDSITRGYIDFKAKEIGHSKLKTEVKDFLDDMPGIVFGEDSYKCECRKRGE